jgi:hypothetical protein
MELQSAFLNAEQDSLEEKTVLEEADRIFKALIRNGGQVVAYEDTC